MRLTATIDAKSLSPQEARRLRELIETAKFFQLPSVMTSRHPGADRFQYKVTVEAENRQHTVEVGEAAAPAVLRPLLTWLTERARERR